MASNILRMLVSCHTCSEKEAMLAGLPQIMRMRFAYVLTGCVTASAGILMATDEPISHFSIPEWNWSALIHALVLSVSRELTNGIVYNLATECCWNSKAKRSQTPISNWERKNPHTFQFSCVILFWGGKKKRFLACFEYSRLVWNPPSSQQLHLKSITLPHKTHLSPLKVWPCPVTTQLSSVCTF